MSTIRVAFARNPPDAFSNCFRFPTLDPTLSCPFPGWCVETMKMLADSLNLKINPITFDNAVGSLDWGTLQKNGSWTGVLSYLANNKSDTACLFYQRTELREQYFELSYPVTDVQPVYVVRKQKTTIGSILWNAFKPYSYSTWFGILASFLLQLLVMVFISHVEVKMKKRQVSRPYEMAWQVLQLQLDEKSENMVFHTFSGNGMLFLFALLQSAFFTYLYEGLLLSALIQQTDQNPFKDADEMIDLIAQGKYHLVTNYRGNWYFDELDNSNSSHFAKLRAATLSNLVEVTSSVSDALDLVEKGNYIYPIQEDSLAMQRSKERCNFVYVSKGLPQRSAHLVFPNNSMFLERFNQAIIVQSQFIQRTFSKYFLEGFKIADIPKCPATEFEEGSKPLGVQSVIGIFALGALGMSSALVAFVAEIYHYWHKNVLVRRWLAKSTHGGVQNILAIASMHFEASRDHSFDIMKLMEYKKRSGG